MVTTGDGGRERGREGKREGGKEEGRKNEGYRWRELKRKKERKKC